MGKKCLKLAAALFSFALIAAACGPDDDSSSGSITITGSSTVEPVINLLAEAFAEEHPGVAFSVAGPGSGDGHKAAAAGEVQIWNSSRQIKEEEAADINAAGIDFIELRVGIDGISVITSAANDSIDCLSFEDLYSLIGVESTGFETWADANDLNAEMGGTGPFDDTALEIFAPGEESGTFDSFIEIALTHVWEHRVEEGHADENFAVRPDYNASANDNVIIDGVAGNEHSLGWVGFAFADENRDVVKLVEVAVSPRQRSRSLRPSSRSPASSTPTSTRRRPRTRRSRHSSTSCSATRVRPTWSTPATSTLTPPTSSSRAATGTT